jgi:multidrug efflux pump subunit AcrB
MKEEEKDFPPGLKYSFTGDESKNIRNTVHELENGIITGVVLVVTILLLSMGFKNAFFVSLSIPFSFLISFIVLSSMGVTLNIVVLFSLILVLGIIVDDAIVVTENIYRLQEKEGWSPQDAAIEGKRGTDACIYRNFDYYSVILPAALLPWYCWRVYEISAHYSDSMLILIAFCSIGDQSRARLKVH